MGLFRKYSSRGNFSFKEQQGIQIESLIPHASPACVDLIKQMLTYDPRERYASRTAKYLRCSYLMCSLAQNNCSKSVETSIFQGVEGSGAGVESKFKGSYANHGMAERCTLTDGTLKWSSQEAASPTPTDDPQPPFPQIKKVCVPVVHSSPTRCTSRS